MESLYTFYKNRKCMHCKKPISDQAHALQKFCKRIIMDDGSIQCCKDDYNAAKSKEINDPFKCIVSHHKKMHCNIKNLIGHTGDLVSLEQINRAGIVLERPVKIAFSKEGLQKFYFIEYLITRINLHQYKITKHNELL